MNIQQKYQKVKLLRKNGATEGERQAAKMAMKRMEERYPELSRTQQITVNFVEGDPFVGGHRADIIINIWRDE